MATKRTLWFVLSSGLWFVPGILLLGSIATALGLIAADARCDDAMRRTLNHHLQLIDGGAAGGIPSASDRTDVVRRVQRLRETHKL